jgi:hypothetical protein
LIYFRKISGLSIGAAFLALFNSCQPLIDRKKVEGSWIIRKDTSAMQVVFTPDSVFIGYEPRHTLFAYSYKWKQDEERGLIECYSESPLASDPQGREIRTSQLYVLKVSDDSLSLLIPKLKTRFDLAKMKTPK